MNQHTTQELAAQFSAAGIHGKTVGIHSQLSAIGEIVSTPVSSTESAKGMKPFAKTVIEALLIALGDKGTFFVPTHTVNTMSHFGLGRTKIDGSTVIDDGYFRAETTTSSVGSFTQSVLADSRAIRSIHPTHSTAAIGPEAKYLTYGHDHTVQPVGIQNAFTKLIGLDGLVMFIGPVLGSNTSFHAYETLMLPALSDYLPGVAATVIDGVKRLVTQTWVPHFHRDFYMESKRPTRAWNKIREANLLHSAPLGSGTLYWYEAKKIANFFANEVFPKEPDILFCDSTDKCNTLHDCLTINSWLKELYSDGDKWSASKITAGMDRKFLSLLKPGRQRI
ncbi:MAG: AAC(3) family N-acetyltransferase [Fibrobacteres bacterium]|nr:AAC(3) family N-acetyltransferase [Fibrobacterota bacterium]